MSEFEHMQNKDEALELGAVNPQHAWVCTSRDSWEPNPFYSGPPVRHPGDDADLYADLEEAEAIMEAAFGPVMPLIFGYPF